MLSVTDWCIVDVVSSDSGLLILASQEVVPLFCGRTLALVLAAHKPPPFSTLPFVLIRRKSLRIGLSAPRILSAPDANSFQPRFSQQGLRTNIRYEFD